MEAERKSFRRGARVVEWGGLENRCTLAGTVGSNPTPSALIIYNELILLLIFIRSTGIPQINPRIFAAYTKKTPPVSASGASKLSGLCNTSSRLNRRRPAA